MCEASCTAPQVGIDIGISQTIGMRFAFELGDRLGQAHVASFRYHLPRVPLEKIVVVLHDCSSGLGLAQERIDHR